MPKTLSPKQVARALAVSESSLKRWCDRGLIRAATTSGGHRRVQIDSVLKFVKETGRRLVHPELLALPARTGRGPRTIERSRSDVQKALLDGDEIRVRQALIDLHVAGVPLSRIGDEVLAPAFRGIGEAWACGSAEVYHERRAVETCSRAIHGLRELLPTPAVGAALAIGGAPGSDPYSLAGAIVELVLRQRGWEAHHLGSQLPFNTLIRAVEQMRPKLIWLSVSHIESEAQFLSEYEAFWRAVGGKVTIVVGGQALHQGLRSAMRYSAFCDTLQHLEEFVRAAQLESADSPQGRSARRRRDA